MLAFVRCRTLTFLDDRAVDFVIDLDSLNQAQLEEHSKRLHAAMANLQQAQAQQKIESEKGEGASASTSVFTVPLRVF